ncbi:Uncharacterised protein [Mycobacteroides abscessus subsp. abscessus]|nr:Uncharacterised protein [Mycobacteroides abscessus subsp. abscessus]
MLHRLARTLLTGVGLTGTCRTALLGSALLHLVEGGGLLSGCLTTTEASVGVGDADGAVADGAELRGDLRQVDGAERGDDELFGDLREDVADEEDEARADDVRQEAEDPVRQTLQRREHLVEGEELEDGDEAEDPDDEPGDLTDGSADLLPVVPVSLQSGDLRHELRDRPFDDRGDDPGDDENDDCKAHIDEDRPYVLHFRCLLRMLRLTRRLCHLLFRSLFHGCTLDKGHAPVISNHVLKCD